jgi:hypothetical protein
MHRDEAFRTLLLNRSVSVVIGGKEKEFKNLMDKVVEKVEAHDKQQLNHASVVIARLWQLSSGYRLNSPQKPPAHTLSGLIRHMNSSRPDKPPLRVELALIESIRKGIFFDRKYWARDLENLRPIYISSTLTGEGIDLRE